MVYHDSKIIIVGGGVFGLSTALWLARSGYENITVFDRCPLDKKHYDPSDGCDRASADINKIFRMAYGDKQTSAPPDVLTRVQRHIGLYSYQDLAIEARDIWLSWNEDIARSSLTTLPDGELLYECGCYFLAKGPELREFFQASLDTMGRSAPEIRRMQFVKDNAEDKERLRRISPKWVEKLHVIDRINGGNTNGFLDIQAGVTIADKVDCPELTTIPGTRGPHAQITLKELKSSIGLHPLLHGILN